MPAIFGVIAFFWMCYAIGTYLIEPLGDGFARSAAAVRGRPAPAPRKPKRKGFRTFLGEVWHGGWERRARALRAWDEANPPEGGATVSWRDRWRAARGQFDDDSSDGEEAGPGDEPTPGATGPESTDSEPEAAPQSQQQPDAWNAPTPSTGTKAAGEDPVECQVCHAAFLSVASGRLACPNPNCPSNTADEAPTGPRHAAPEPTQGGTTVTAPTGEVVNYETHVAELNAEIAEQRKNLDSLDAAVRSCAETKARVDEAQQNLQSSAGAAQAKQEHLQGLNLDSTTLAHAATATDALAPNQVNDLYEQMEAMEAELQKRRDDAATALAALEAELAHIQAKHGDHAAHVAGELGGDARYLDSGTGTVTSSASTPQPVSVAA